MTAYIDKIKSYIENFKWKKDNKFLVYLIFVGIATILWFLNRLNNTYDAEITYPVTYTNIPSDKKILNDLKPSITLKVNAPGYTLLQYKMKTTRKPLTMDLKKGTLVRRNSKRFYLLTKDYRNKIADQLKSDVKLQSVEPDTMFFNFTEIVTRKKPVIPVYKISLAQQYQLKSNPHCTPDSVVITGPEIILDTLKGVYTSKVSIKDINRSTKRNVSVKDIRELSISPKRVVVNIDVEQYTEIIMKLPIKKINVPDSLNLIIFNDSVQVKGLIGEDSYNLLSPDKFEVEVDFNDIVLKKDSLLNVNIKTKPGFYEMRSYYPQKIEYLIERK
ncbi:MAG: CdaR family protein [Bacteroidales bacterium]|jgi:hypothetical protein|nr:CdaR family protein [Bacteroidales bacterium]